MIVETRKSLDIGAPTPLADDPARRVETGSDAVSIAVDPAVQFGLLYRYRLPGRPSSHSQAGGASLGLRFSPAGHRHRSNIGQIIALSRHD